MSEFFSKIFLFIAHHQLIFKVWLFVRIRVWIYFLKRTKFEEYIQKSASIELYNVLILPQKTLYWMVPHTNVDMVPEGLKI